MSVAFYSMTFVVVVVVPQMEVCSEILWANPLIPIAPNVHTSTEEPYKSPEVAFISRM